MRPMAIGIDVVPMLIRSNAAFTRGKITPIPTPAAIARKIHRVRYRSRNESRRKTEVWPIVIVALIRELPVLPPTATLALSLGFIQKMGLADFLEALPKRGTVEVIEV